jgi:hypothetical protein
VAAAVEAGEAVTGFPAGIRHGRKGDGGVVEGAAGLLVEQMHFGHHCDRADVPRWGRLFLSGNLLFRMTPLAFGFVVLDTGEMWSKVSHPHWPATAWFRAGEVFVLESLNESTVNLAFLF